MDIWIAFTFLAIINNAGMNICIQILGRRFSFLLNIHIEVELLGHMVKLYLTF